MSIPPATCRRLPWIRQDQASISQGSPSKRRSSGNLRPIEPQEIGFCVLNLQPRASKLSPRPPPPKQLSATFPDCQSRNFLGENWKDKALAGARVFAVHFFLWRPYNGLLSHLRKHLKST